MRLLLFFCVFINATSFSQPYSEPQNRILSNDFAQIQSVSREPKSPLIGALCSFLIPGLGEVYAGNFETGRYYLGAEIALLIGVGAQWIRGSSYESDYQVLARTNAGVSGGKDAQFWKDISNFNSIEEFNNDRLRARDYARLYNPQTHFWEWNNETQRRQYRDLRIRSDEAYQSIYYVLAAMGVNRLVSMINAARGVNKDNESNGFKNDEEIETSLRFLPQHNGGSLLPDGIRADIRVAF